MKKSFQTLLILLCISIGSSLLASQSVFATEGDFQEETESGSETNTEETESPALKLPIESNKTADWPQGPAVVAESAVVMDAASGAILYSKDCDAKKYPASITKIMTTLVALENGKLDDVLTFSENAIYSIEPDSTNLGIQPGEQLTLEQSLYGVLLASANEIANGVAEHVGGSIDEFVQMMNDKAAALGCTNTHFVNPHGLHDDNHYTSARDMALITQAALKNKEFCKIAGTVEYMYPKTNLVDEERYFINHQRMLYEEGSEYEGCLGGKTGFTDMAWNTLVTFAQRDKMKLICVVLKTNGLYVTIEESTQLLDYAYSNFTQQKEKNKEAFDTFASVMQVPCLGISTYIIPEGFQQKIWKTARQTTVTLPNGVDWKEVKQTWQLDEGNVIYTYHDWQVGKRTMRLQSFLPQLHNQAPYRNQVIQTVTSKTTTVAASGTAQTKGIKGKLMNVLETVKNVLVSTYEKVDLFMKDNTVESAVIGAILLLIFVPLLITGVVRNHRYKRLMKEREQQQLLLREKEAQIEQKSAVEIAEEIRREEEARKAEEARAEARKKAAQEASKELEAAEKILGENILAENKEE